MNDCMDAPSTWEYSKVLCRKILQVLRALAIFRVYIILYCGYSEHWQYFEVLYCGYFRTGSISEFAAVDTSGLEVFRGSVLRVPQVLLILLLSICPVSSEYEVYFEHLSIISCPFCRRKYSQEDGPTSGSWSILLSVGATGVLRVLAVFRDYLLRVLSEFRGSVLRILRALQIFRGLILRVLPVLGVLSCSYSKYAQYLGLQYCSFSQYSQHLGRQYSKLQYSTKYSVRNVGTSRVYLKYQVYWEHL